MSDVPVCKNSPVGHRTTDFVDVVQAAKFAIAERSTNQIPRPHRSHFFPDPHDLQRSALQVVEFHLLGHDFHFSIERSPEGLAHAW